MPSRRQLIQMTPQEIDAYLGASQERLIIVSNGKNGFPHPMPMNFYMDEGKNLWTTTFRKSQKVKNLERDPRVALLVESGKDYAELKAVIIYAQVEIIDDKDVVLDTLIKIASRFLPREQRQLDAVRAEVQSTAEKRVALKCTPLSYVSWDHTKLEGHY